jgi:hypothetical protein
MNYEVYRNTTLGNSLQEVLDDLIHVLIRIRFKFYNIFKLKKFM